MREYRQYLSDRAMGILALLKEPKSQEIRKQKSPDFIGEVGTYFRDILTEKNISIEILRKLMRAELYGIAGVFFINFRALHSLKPADNNFQDDIVAWSSSGIPYTGKIKMKSRQSGLYIPEAVKNEFELAIDNEEFCFSKTIEESSVPILEYISRKTKRLRKVYGNNWYPYFSNNSIARELGTDEPSVASATKNLTGILCECHQTVNCREGLWRLRYFLPTSKYASIRGIL